jgi:hypothetical protein
MARDKSALDKLISHHRKGGGKGEKMTNKVYDALKWLASPGLPALAALFVAASEIWNLPVLALVGMTVAAVGACFGEWTGQSSKKFFADKEIITKEQNNNGV